MVGDAATNVREQHTQQYNLLLESLFLLTFLREIRGQLHYRLNTSDQQLLKVKTQNSLKVLIFFTKENVHQGHYFHR